MNRRTAALVELVLIIAMALSGGMIISRAWLGPLDSPVHMHSPLNAESIFGLAVVAFVVVRTIPGERLQESGGRYDVWIILGLAAVIVGVFWRSTSWYFLSDDFILLKYAAQPARYLWPTFTRAGGDGFYRPLIYASLAWPQLGLNPRAWHTLALLLHFANTILVFRLVLQLRFSRFVAAWAAALFATHATRPEVVIWVTGRFDLVATFFTLLALVLFLESRDSNNSIGSVALKITALIAMILGLISKESAYATPVVLLVILIATGDWRSWRSARGYLAFFAAAVAVFAFRWSLFHGIGGYLTAQGAPQAMSLRAVTVAKAVFFRLWAILFFPINWSIQPGIILAAAMASYLVALGAMSRARLQRRDLALIFALLFALLLPVTPVVLIGADLEKARYLYLPSIAFCLLLAKAADRSGWRWSIVSAIFLFQVVAIWHNLAPWKAASEAAQSGCEVVAHEKAPARVAVIAIPGYLDGVQTFANGFRECVELRNPDHAEVTMLDRSATSDSFDRVYEWDEASRRLKRVR
jgi:hypothetical protein